VHPAFSVIFFTTLSGAGYGLLFWSALAGLTARVPPKPLLMATAIGLVLVTIGLLSSLAHLGKPTRSWRAFSQWRTSWLSREGVVAVLTYVPALLFAALLLPAMIGPGPLGVATALNLRGMLVCGLLAACALATVYCTAMIYASLKPIPAWSHRFVVPGYFGFALLSGGLLLCAIASLSGASFGNAPAMAAVALAGALWWLKGRYWSDIDSTPPPMTRGDAVGLPGRKVTVFERPHTESNYLVREMGFVVARKHSRRLRRAAVMLFALVPIACMLPVWVFVHFDPAPAFALATGSTLLGAFVERWLFFAEAKHLVTLYY